MISHKSLVDHTWPALLLSSPCFHGTGPRDIAQHIWQHLQHGGLQQQHHCTRKELSLAVVFAAGLSFHGQSHVSGCYAFEPLGPLGPLGARARHLVL